MAYMRATDNYYADERRVYSEAYGIYFSNKQAVKVIKKLGKHYKVSVPVKFRGHNQSGCSHWTYISLSHNPSLGLIMHEFSHFAKSQIRSKENLTNPNIGTSHHGTNFQAALNFVNIYAQSKGYWRSILMKDALHKAGEVKKTAVTEKAEKNGRQEVIVKLEKKLATYHKKLQYYQRLYTTKIKKANRSLGAHKRFLEKDLTSNKLCVIVSANEVKEEGITNETSI